MDSRSVKNAAALAERFIYTPPLLADLKKGENNIKKRVDYLCYSHNFYISTFQTDFRINKIYFAYRWVICLLSGTSCLITSVIPTTKDEKPPSWYLKYLIYLSNWSLMVMFISTSMGAILISIGVKHFGFNTAVPIDENIKKHQWIYWKLQELAILAAVGVSTTFFFVINPKSMQSDTSRNSILSHGINSVYAVIDWLITGLPWNFSDFWLLLVYGSLYFFFTYIYWEAGGTGKFKHDPGMDPRVLYGKCTDWNRPSVVFVCFFVCMAHASLAHVILCALNKLRVKCMLKPHPTVHVIDPKGTQSAKV